MDWLVGRETHILFGDCHTKLDYLSEGQFTRDGMAAKAVRFVPSMKG
jgi:hypothetical protein